MTVTSVLKRVLVGYRGAVLLQRKGVMECAIDRCAAAAAPPGKPADIVSGTAIERLDAALLATR